MEEENGCQNVIYSELFQKLAETTASTSCRYLLKQIKGHTYIVNDKTVLEDVEERLENILQIMKCHFPPDIGFLVNSSLEKHVNEKRSTPIMKNYHISDFENQNLLDALVAPMSGESFIVKYP